MPFGHCERKGSAVCVRRERRARDGRTYYCTTLPALLCGVFKYAAMVAGRPNAHRFTKGSKQIPAYEDDDQVGHELAEACETGEFPAEDRSEFEAALQQGETACLTKREKFVLTAIILGPIGLLVVAPGGFFIPAHEGFNSLVLPREPPYLPMSSPATTMPPPPPPLPMQPPLPSLLSSPPPPFPPSLPPPLQPPPPPPRTCSSDCVRNGMPLLPLLTANNAAVYPLWHEYVVDVYHERITGGTVIDLNTFSFFYKGKPATDALFSRSFDPCLSVCTLRSWPDRVEVFDGTLFVGDAGPEKAIGDFAFFVVRPFIVEEQALSCDTLEVMHVRTDWLGGEHGASWFFHAVGSGVKIDCHNLPTQGTIGVYKDRKDWLHKHGWNDYAWDARGDTKIAERMEMDGHAMLIFTAAGFTVFNQAGNNPSTEIVVRHKKRDSSEVLSARGSCLDDDDIGFQLSTGISKSVACTCRQEEHHTNCYDTPRPEAVSRTGSKASPAHTASQGAVAALYRWEKHSNLNCWWNGHGAEEVDSPAGSSVAGVDTLLACKTACSSMPNQQCEGILFNRATNDCYRKRSINIAACPGAADFDMYELSFVTPPLPPVPPPLPRPPPPPAAFGVVAADLNARFNAGGFRGLAPGATLRELGVFVHQFDFMDDENPDKTPWVVGAGCTGKNRDRIGCHPDRISAALINAAMTPEYSGNVPIYSFSLGGIILSPDHNSLLCSYAYDVESLERACDPPGVSARCTPGCTFGGNGGVQWCNDVGRDDFPCTWKPLAEEQAKMMQRREAIRASGIQPMRKRFKTDGKFYNELIFDAAAFTANLPNAIEAVFYLREDCSDAISGPKCEDYSRAAHRSILKHFGLTPGQVPFLRFQPWDWTTPFYDESDTNCADGRCMSP